MTVLAAHSFQELLAQLEDECRTYPGDMVKRQWFAWLSTEGEDNYNRAIAQLDGAATVNTVRFRARERGD